MKRSAHIKLAVVIQILVIFMIQFNTLAPQVTRLLPAIATGDLSECRCSLECRCPLENRKNGICCCKQAKKLKLKMHCNAVPTTSKTASLRSCSCGGWSHAHLISPDNQVYLGFFETPPSFAVYSDKHPAAPEPQQLLDRTPEPPDPPPRLFS